jgi:hypothetical protein
MFSTIILSLVHRKNLSLSKDFLNVKNSLSIGNILKFSESIENPNQQSDNHESSPPQIEEEAT